MMNDAKARIMALLAGARRLADPNDLLGRRVRQELARAQVLSPANVELALTRCLEVNASAAELGRFLSYASPCATAHVLLASNVFIAASRAIALGLASSERVLVRPSRREPSFARALDEAAPGLFQVVTELAPEPGDHLWAYGSDDTMRGLQGLAESGVVLHAHATGIGVVVLDQAGLQGLDENALGRIFSGIALDTSLFDQRGCLSPRLVLIQGSQSFATDVEERLVAALDECGRSIPFGQLGAEEIADVSWYRGTVRALGRWRPAGMGGLAVLHDQWRPLPPLGRSLNLCLMTELETALRPLAPLVTQVAYLGADEVGELIKSILPKARICAPGMMQRPPFDGPVDLRAAR